VLRTNLRDTKRSTPRSVRAGVLRLNCLVGVAVMAVAVVFLLGRFVHHRRPDLSSKRNTPGHQDRGCSVFGLL
jgi:hypothetical protein